MLGCVAVSGGTRRELEPGDTLGGYRLEESLGEGGMGLVFRALRVEDGREVALKVLKIELAGDLVFQHRFRQEARAGALAPRTGDVTKFAWSRVGPGETR